MATATRINIKPLSSNEAWKGRRFKTPVYKKYERDVLLMLPRLKVPDGELIAYYKFGFSSRNSDWDNPVKMIQDILQKKYGFNDNKIYKAVTCKEIVPKGQEYIEFSLVAA